MWFERPLKPTTLLGLKYGPKDLTGLGFGEHIGSVHLSARWTLSGPDFWPPENLV